MPPARSCDEAALVVKLFVIAAICVGAFLWLQALEGDHASETVPVHRPAAVQDVRSVFLSPAVEATHLGTSAGADTPRTSGDRPVAPSDPKETQRSRDLKATLDHFVSHMDASADAAIRARDLLDFCTRIADDLTRPGSAVAAFPAHDDHYALRTTGANELRSRCHGITRLSGSERVALRQRMDTALTRAGHDPMDASLHSSVLTPPVRLRSVLDSGHADEMQRVLPALQRAYATAHGIAEDTVAGEELAMAFAIVACGMDGSCTPDSLDTVTRCVYQSLCESSGTGSRRRYSQIEDGRVLQYDALAAQLASSIQHRDFKQLGIDR